ncbi:MAG TPA: FkbM family methyltransferase [Longimicrobiaceae bacterium]|nr:FkbM family methyltransferase [Longimicrobiaceae bacterium]
MVRLANVWKPEYLFRPVQVYRRLQRLGAPAPEVATLVLPWGLPIEIRPGETIGRLLWALGVFELSVTETLWRLAEPGELAVDVGGNIGYMTSVLAVRAGERGRVETFEPHPVLFAELERNLARWSGRPGLARVVAHPAAVGDAPGEAMLSVADSFEGNRGLSRIEAEGGPAGRTIPVRLESLDHVFGADERIGVLKVDVEGYELNVLRGAEGLLRDGRIRDVVFEDEGEYPTPVTRFLEERGYTVFSLRPQLRGPSVRPAADPVPPLRMVEAQNYVASVDPERVRRRLAPWGWECLRGRSGD